MHLKKLYERTDEPMKVAGFMSGSGSNLRKIIEYQKHLDATEGRSAYKVVVIFSDNAKSNAVEIGAEYNIPVVVRDIKSYYSARKVPLSNTGMRRMFDGETAHALSPYGIEVAAYAGYMSIASSILVNEYLGVNVHPADLSIMESGRRKYTGHDAVKKALVAREKEIRSSTHIVTEEVDAGRILMVSAPVKIGPHDDICYEDDKILKVLADGYQEVLKKRGDWEIFPVTLEDIAKGRFQHDLLGNMYYNEMPIPAGYRHG